MFNAAELYELSFVAPNRKRRTKPQLLFTVKTEHLSEISRRLHVLAIRHEEHARAYCPKRAHFHPLASDLFGRIEFGYGKCGHVIIDGTEARLYIELRKGHDIYASALTLHLLTWAFGLPIEHAPHSNREQQVDIHTRCEHRHTYGHAVGGYVSSSVRGWLRTQVEKTHGKDYIVIDRRIIEAMRTTWKAISNSDFVPPAQAFGGYISADGRFSIYCCGDACDLSIYPDQLYRTNDATSSVPFSCHNLDTAEQQLTLLAGLARLCELARKDES